MMVRESIRVFAEAMEKKLQRDDQVKPPWETVNLVYLFNRLCEEVGELGDAEGHRDKMLECCDVANFAMMIFSQLHPDTRHLVRGRNTDPPPFVHGDVDMPNDTQIMRKGL